MHRPTKGARWVVGGAVIGLLWMMTSPTARSQTPQATLDLPAPVETQHAVSIESGQLAYSATAGLLPVGDDPSKAEAAIFYIAYTVKGQKAAERPITFLFNGGPGASSAFLHLGGIGPQKLRLNADGTPPPPPVPLEDNALTWLTFTDLVFVDPVGTGYSHVSPLQTVKTDENKGQTGDTLGKFWGFEQDLASLGAFIRLYLTRSNRWVSPKVLAGESYGGLRVAALSQRLPMDFDIPLNGAILISPALEYALLQGGSDYNLLPWMVTLPSFAATAAHHGRNTLAGRLTDLPTALMAVETFALSEMLTGLARADTLPVAERDAFYTTLANFTGLSPAFVARRRGRISIALFAKELLRDQGLLVGRYDSTVTGPDPYPEELGFAGGDPSFELLTSLYAPALLKYLRDDLQYRRDMVYRVLNLDTHRKWDFASALPGKQGFIGVSGNLKRSLIVNPALQVLLTHGYHDLVTPFFASRYLVDQMGLPSDSRARIRLQTYLGGHMFYLRQSSLQAFYADVSAFYRQFLP